MTIEDLIMIVYNAMPFSHQIEQLTIKKTSPPLISFVWRGTDFEVRFDLDASSTSSDNECILLTRLFKLYEKNNPVKQNKIKDK